MLLLPPYHRLTRGSAALLLMLLTTCVPTGGRAPVPIAPSPQEILAPIDPEPITAPETAGSATLQLHGSAGQGAIMRGLVPAGTRTLTLDGEPVAFDREGNFIIAFDRDAGPSATLVATRANGDVQRRTIEIIPGNWKIEQINASPTGRATSAEFQRLRAGELAQINAARARAEQSDGWRQNFIWPVKARISGVFGSQRVYRGQPGSYHSGLDLAGGAGTVYVAPADGVVILATDHPFTLEGNLLMIDHGMGLNSAFLHSQTLLVKQGEIVRQGQPIGIIGATGRVTGPHLHWSMKWHAARIDPLLLLDDRSAPKSGS